MKNLYFIILISLILFSCERIEENPIQEEVYSPSFLKYKNQNDLILIELDSLKNYSELITKMGKISCANKVAGLKFTYENIEYNLTGSSDCPTSNMVACYFRVNLLIIKNDSIVYDLGNRKNKVPIENLENQLNDIISSPYNFNYDKNELKPAIIYLYIEEKYPISKTKKVLKEIVEKFENINKVNKPGFFEYNILFEGYDMSNIPPPPPPPKEIKR